MSVRLATPSAAVLLACLAGPLATAQAQYGPNRLLWATVNTCDTLVNPNKIGIRASMPGSEKGREAMYMRFKTQYLSAEDGQWHNVSGEGDSGFLYVGRSNKTRQKGRSLTIEPTNESIVLRGTVVFEWRRAGKVVRRSQERTHKGYKSSVGADPTGFSSAFCTITR